MIKNIITSIIFLFITFPLTGQVFKIDHSTTKKRIIEEMETSIPADTKDSLKNAIFNQAMDLSKAMLIKQYGQMEDYLLIQADSVSYFKGANTPLVYTNSKKKFDEEVEFKNDTIFLKENHLVFVKTKEKDVLKRIEAIKKEFQLLEIEKQKEKALIESIWTFENKKISYDTILAGEVATAKFVFQNNSDKDLTLTRVENACPNTRLFWPDYPIRPGNKDSIIMTYNTRFVDLDETKKLIYVKCNLHEAPVFLEMNGVIVEEKNRMVLESYDAEKGVKEVKEYEIINQWEDSYIWIEADGKTGLLDAQKNIIIEPFVEGDIIVLSDYIWVIHNKKQGLYDFEGKEILPLIYHKLEFNTSKEWPRYTLKDSLGNTKQGYFDDNWNKRLDKDYCSVREYFTQIIVVSEDCINYTMLSKATLEQLTSETFTYLHHAGNGKLSASKDKVHFGLIDKNGKLLIPMEYEEIKPIHYKSKSQDSIFQAKKAGKYGIIDISGKKLVDFKYDRIYLGKDILACSMDDKWGLTDLNNNTIIPFVYDQLKLPRGEFNKYVVRKEGKYGVINDQHEILIDFNYDALDMNESEFLVAKTGKKWALLDKEGNPLSEYIFDQAKWFRNQIQVRIEKERFYVDLDLNCVINCPGDEFLEKYGLKKR